MRKKRKNRIYLVIFILIIIFGIIIITPSKKEGKGENGNIIQSVLSSKP